MNLILISRHALFHGHALRQSVLIDEVRSLLQKIEILLRQLISRKPLAGRLRQLRLSHDHIRLPVFGECF